MEKTRHQEIIIRKKTVVYLDVYNDFAIVGIEDMHGNQLSPAFTFDFEDYETEDCDGEGIALHTAFKCFLRRASAWVSIGD